MDTPTILSSQRPIKAITVSLPSQAGCVTTQNSGSPRLSPKLLDIQLAAVSIFERWCFYAPEFILNILCQNVSSIFEFRLLSKLCLLITTQHNLLSYNFVISPDFSLFDGNIFYGPLFEEKLNFSKNQNIKFVFSVPELHACSGKFNHYQACQKMPDAYQEGLSIILKITKRSELFGFSGIGAKLSMGGKVEEIDFREINFAQQKVSCSWGFSDDLKYILDNVENLFPNLKTFRIDSKLIFEHIEKADVLESIWNTYQKLGGEVNIQRGLYVLYLVVGQLSYWKKIKMKGTAEFLIRLAKDYIQSTNQRNMIIQGFQMCTVALQILVAVAAEHRHDDAIVYDNILDILKLTEMKLGETMFHMPKLREIHKIQTENNRFSIYDLHLSWYTIWLSILKDISSLLAKNGNKKQLRILLDYYRKALNCSKSVFDNAKIYFEMGVISLKLKLSSNQMLPKGIEHLETALQCLQNASIGDAHNAYMTFFGSPTGSSNFFMTAWVYLNSKILYELSNIYHELGCELNHEKTYIRKALEYSESCLAIQYALSLKARNLVSLKDHCFYKLFFRLAINYGKLGDSNKKLEYLKQAYGICFSDDYSGKFHETIESIIKSSQPNFFMKLGLRPSLKEQDRIGSKYVGLECRWPIYWRKVYHLADLPNNNVASNHMLLLKEKIQESVLNPIGRAVNECGWSKVNIFGIDWGVKGYLDKSYLKNKLEEFGKDDNNIEIALMFCFEAMILAVLNSEKKPYPIVEEFTRNNPDLVKKIAEDYPSFFVDGSIVEICASILNSDAFFVDYIGRKERKSFLSR